MRALRDGFADHARASADRGAERLHRLLDAQDDVRHAAAAGTALTPELLARWNRITLGVPVARFRRGPAYAKNGRERYGLHPATEHWFATCVAQGDETAAPLAARAARLYLDVAFFHPYDDGNARLAGLALQFVLLREQVELDDVVPVLNPVRRADDADGAADLARLIHGMAAATHRRRLRASRHPGSGGGDTLVDPGVGW
ncbi:Fic family protein [Catellatospora sp. IY07-71]|uniref:Fic family protein n=1 Tax=Catellatospora sp. IY07-71 TaxID=2728827 RepID=UPI001BB3867C|nr:Fic family protein [Catellatospora sp. IY07-71]